MSDDMSFIRGELFGVEYDALINRSCGIVECKRRHSDPYVYKLDWEFFYGDCDELITKAVLSYINSLDEYSEYVGQYDGKSSEIGNLTDRVS